EVFTNSVTWSVSGFELSSMSGPALGGMLIAWFGAATSVYLLAGLGSVFYFTMLARLTPRAYIAEQSESSKSGSDIGNLVAGFNYVRNTGVLLAGMSLDLFAVLFGGAVALLPIYAKDILHVGPAGLGWMQAAPSLGAITMAMITNHLPPMKK